MKTPQAIIKNGIKDLALTAGWRITKRTDESELLSFIRSLRPVNCGKELIRLGGNADGGYLIPNDLEEIEFCFSPGVSTIADFESHLAELNIKSFLADYSVDRPPVERAEFTFDKRFLGADDDDTSFTLQSWKNKYLKTYKGDLLLQMDIEGAEYEVICSTPPATLGAFRIMVIEFHFLEKLFDPFAFNILFRRCFEKLLRQFYVVHLHPNNYSGVVRAGEVEIPRFLEITFYNKNRAIGPVTQQGTLPHPLDRDNVPGNKSLRLDQMWFT